ncbi:MAG TPA: helix-turn-helix domain-containing protein [Stellaceae bacterium]|nr:helix-turn-helix domain-containing protein [Stellaceae bacterium]
MDTDTHDRRICPRAADFTRTDRRRLEQALKQTRNVRLYRRLQGVLGVAEGAPVHAVAHRVQAGRVSLWRWVARYLARRNPQDLCDPPRPGPQPLAPALTREKLAALLTSDPQSHGYDTNGWTVPLLRAHLAAQEGVELSTRTLRRRLHVAGFRWKRALRL